MLLDNFVQNNFCTFNELLRIIISVFVDNPGFVGGKVGINGGAGDTILSVFNGQFALNVETSTVSTATSSAAAAATASPIVSTTSTLATASSTVKRPFMFVILGSSNYTQDAQNMLAWIQNTYH